MSDSMSKFKDLFCSEVEDQLGVLSQTLLEIEKSPGDPERYGTLMRSAHTIKGAAATMGYNEMANLAHALEDLFHAGEIHKEIIGESEISVSLHALDVMKASLQSIREKDQELPVGDFVETIVAALAHASEVRSTTSNGEKHAMPTATLPPREYAYSIPTAIRVGVERLDSLMGLFEEMLMLRLKLDTILGSASEIHKTITDPQLKQKIYFLTEFKTLFGELARLLSTTQDELLQIRLVPLEQIFSQFPRMVRDLATREGKKIELHVEGGEVELDRTVLDGIGGALAHLLRNAVDHGIVHEGVIILSALRVNERIHVIVEDDGAGIDYERVRRVAVERGVVSFEEAQKLRTTEIAELLFREHLSTNTELTDISGRGVGLAAVRAFTKDVGGRVSLSSPINEKGGTRFLLDLPISLATVKVLLVETSGFTFAISFTNIVRTISFSREAIVTSAHQETIVYEGKSIPLLWLENLLGITFAGVFRPHAEEGDELNAVLVNVGDEHVLLGVDACKGEQELLVKSLPPLLRNIKGFSGSTLLPDGRTILLLDTSGLLLQAFDVILGNTKSDVLLTA